MFEETRGNILDWYRQVVPVTMNRGEFVEHLLFPSLNWALKKI